MESYSAKNSNFCKISWEDQRVIFLQFSINFLSNFQRYGAFCPVLRSNRVKKGTERDERSHKGKRSKSGSPQGLVGSNPTASTNENPKMPNIAGTEPLFGFWDFSFCAILCDFHTALCSQSVVRIDWLHYADLIEQAFHLTFHMRIICRFHHLAELACHFVILWISAHRISFSIGISVIRHCKDRLDRLHRVSQLVDIIDVSRSYPRSLKTRYI